MIVARIATIPGLRQTAAPALALAILAGLHAASAAPAPTFVEKPCERSKAEPRLTCGTVAVPENRAQPAGRTIALNVVVVRAARKRVDAVPMFHLEGGPGIAVTPVADFYLGPGALYAAARDVVLVDQRGTGASSPLRCPAAERRAPWDDEYDPGVIAGCRKALEQGADLTQYSTDNAASDLDDVRAALGYGRIDLWGLSYGTRLAQVYVRRFPARVHAAVLTGFAPLDYRAPLFHAVNAQRVLDALFAECARDTACSARYPALRAEWDAVLRRFADGSVPVTVNGNTVSVRRGPVMEVVRNMLTTAAGQRRLPGLIHAAAAGDTGALLSGGGGGAPIADGAYLSIVCSEAVPRIPRDSAAFTNGTFLGDYRVRQERAACAQWARYGVDEAFYAKPNTGVPILVISGTMDHVTSPRWAREFCAATRGCTLVSIPALGHGPFDLDEWTGGECFDQLAAGFLETPGRVDTACVGRMRPPPFK